MATKKLKSIITIDGWHARSVDISRDYDDASVFDGYVLTPHHVKCLEILLDGLSTQSQQRAWMLSGHYGVGKSALSLLLVSLLTEVGHPVAKKLRAICGKHPSLAAKLRVAEKYQPIFISGTNRQFSIQLIKAVESLLKDTVKGAGRPPSVMKTIKKCIEQAERVELSDYAAVEVFDQFLEYWKTKERDGGKLLLVVDEMGRIVERMLTNHEQAAPAIFQYLAEKSAAGGPLAMLGISHRQLYEYAAEWDGDTLKEWSRVVDRFEHVVLDGSIDQLMFMLKQCVVVGDAAIKLEASHWSEKIKKRCPMKNMKLAATAADDIFPLHPAMVIVLREVLRRFLQNDRSLFSFLASAEAGGLQDFLARESAVGSSWYRIEHLVTYLLNGNLRVTDIERRRKIAVLEDIVRFPPDDDMECRILLTVAILAIVQPVAEMPLTVETIAWALSDDSQCEKVQKGIDDLIAKGRIHRRQHDGILGIWAIDGVDLASEFEQSLSKQGEIPVEQMSPLLRGWDDLTAHRHYLETGHLREAGLEINEYGRQIPLPGTAPRPAVQLILVPAKKPRSSVIKHLRKHSATAGSCLIVITHFLSDNEYGILRHWAAWKALENNCADLRADALARAEVKVQIREHEAKIRSMLGLEAAFCPDSAFKKLWFHDGKNQQVKNMRDLQNLLSVMMGSIYQSAPIICNELINRPKLSAALSSARNRLIEAMLDNHEEESLGIIGTPPEMLMYQTLLKSACIHKKSEMTQKLGLFVPDGDSPAEIRQVWTTLDEALVRERDGIEVKALCELLQSPPFGLHAPVAVLFTALYFITRWEHLSLMERGSLQLALNKELFLRYFKNPANFRVRGYDVSDQQEDILKSYGEVSAFAGVAEAPGTVVVIAREVYKWYNSHSPYTLATNNISHRAKLFRAALEQAREPYELLMIKLPAIIAGDKKRFTRDAFTAGLNEITTEIDQCYLALLNRLEHQCQTAFIGGLTLTEGFRDHLISEFQSIHSMLSGKEKLFCERVRRSLDNGNGEWYAGLAAAVCGSHPQRWDDVQSDAFAYEIRAIASSLQRKKAMASYGENSTNAVRVYVLSASGEEAALVLDAPDDDDDVLSNTSLFDAIRKAGGKNLDHVLVQLLREREEGGIAL